MNPKSVTWILLGSQVVPVIFVITAFMLYKNVTEVLLHLLLIELAFLLPAIIFIWYRKNKNTIYKTSVKYPVLPFLCYLKGLSISLIISFIFLFIAEIVFSKRFGITPFLILTALISSLLSSYIAIKQSNF